MKQIFFAALFTIYSSIALSEISPNEIVKKADLKRGLGSVSNSFQVTITNKGDTKVEVYKISFKDINTSLSEQTQPERAKGRKMLMKDYDMWLYTPNIKKPLRISLEQKLTGEVAYGDIAKTNYAEDYEAKMLGNGTVNGQEVYKIELSAKTKKTTYAKIEYSVAKKDFAPVEAIFFALSGKALKRAEFLDFKNIKGIDRSTKMIIYDFIQKDKFSTMIFSNHKEEKFDEAIFNKDSLEF